MGSMWNERYSGDTYVYGTAPNDFLRAMSGQIPPGPVLCLAEGEGRNAVFLAELGHEVTAVDQSPQAMEKARRLAESRGVSVETVTADLRDFDVEPGSWAGVVAIFMHLPPELRACVLARAVEGLRPGGVLVLEGYAPAQLLHGTGGPSVEELLIPLSRLRQELHGLHFLHLGQVEREISEGDMHRGISAVVQVVGRRPEES
jgi:SAM-dependent methyltransferase